MNQLILLLSMCQALLVLVNKQVEFFSLQLPSKYDMIFRNKFKFILSFLNSCYV